MVFVVLAAGGCAMQPVSYDEKTASSVERAIDLFAAEEQLQPYFEQALAYAVFPANWRAGGGFGAAFGQGWLFEDGRVTGRVIMTEVFLGANVGLQGDRKILFFRSIDVLDQLKRGHFEFTGQANASVATVGKAVTPGYHPDVAMFVQVGGGLLLEASVGTQRYDFLALD